MINLKKNLLENISIRQTLVKNTIWLGLAEFIDKGFLILLAVLAARYLGVVEYGKLSFALTFTSFFAVSLDLGLSTLLVVDVSRKKDLAQNYVSNILGIKLILSVINILILFLIANLFSNAISADVKYLIYLFGIYTVITSFNTFFGSLFQSSQKMQLESFSRIVQSLSLFAIAIIFILLRYPTHWIVIAYISGSAIGLLSNLSILLRKRIVLLTPVFKISEFINLLEKAWPFALSIIFNIIYFKIDIVMLGIIKTEKEVGLYVAAYNVIILFYYLPQIVSLAVLPIMSRLYLTSQSKLKKAYQQLFDYHYIFGIFFALILFVYSKQIIVLLFGEGYTQSHIALRILSVAIIFKYIAYTSGAVLTSINKQKKRAFYQGATSLINITLNLFLIPSFGVVGASISTVITEIVLAIFYYRLASKEFYYYKNFKLVTVPLILYSLIICLSLSNNISLFWLPIIIILYLCVLSKFKLISLEIFKSIIKKFT